MRGRKNERRDVGREGGREGGIRHTRSVSGHDKLESHTQGRREERREDSMYMSGTIEKRD